MWSWGFKRYAFTICAASVLPAACGGTHPPIGAPALAGSSRAVPPVRARERPFHGYYLAKFTDTVGSTLPFSAVCLRFTSSGTWSSIPAVTFIGTYLVSGNQLFASAVGPWSPDVYATLQGSVNAQKGFGNYIVMQSSGAIYSGGTFTMTRQRGSGCG